MNNNLHRFGAKNKQGGNKPRPYKTKQIGKRVPEEIHAEIVQWINKRVKIWKAGKEVNEVVNRRKFIKDVYDNLPI